MLDSGNQLDIFGTIIATTGGAFHRFDFVKLTFPKAQHMRLHVKRLGHLANGAKGAF